MSVCILVIKRFSFPCRKFVTNTFTPDHPRSLNLVLAYRSVHRQSWKIPKMDKRLRKHPVICEEDQFNCMIGLVSMLDFRQRRLNHNLMISSPKRRVNNKDVFSREGNVNGKVYLPNKGGDVCPGNPSLKLDQVESAKSIYRLDKGKISKTRRGADRESPVYQCADTERMGTMMSRNEAAHNSISTDQFSKALEVLNWNKELCLKLLQDAKSPRLQDSQAEAGIEEEKNFTYDNLLKKIKNDKHGHTPRTSDNQSASISSVAVLKPRPRPVPISEDVSCNCSVNAHHSFRKAHQSSKSVAFTKKYNKEEETWKTAIKMEDKSNSSVEKKKKKTGKVCQVLSIVNDDSEQKQFDIHLEAKRHMSQRLSNLVQDGSFSSQEPPRTLRRILSLPKHESPTSYERKEQKSADPTKNADEDDDDQLQVSDTIKEKENVNKTGSSSSSCKLRLKGNNSNNNSGMEKREISEEWANGGREEHPSPVSVLEPFFTDYFSSPSTPESQSANSSMLLLPLRLDYEEYSSTAIPSSPAPSAILGTCFDDYDDNEDGGGESFTISKYVKSVLRSCPLNWEDIFLKMMGMSGNLLLDQLFFFDELELCPTDSYWKHKLLFDCTNEAFLDTCRSHFSSLTWLSGFNKDLCVVDHEVIERVNKHFVHRPMPRTLQDLVTDDVMNTWKWMDLRVDIDHIATLTSDLILADLIFNTINSEFSVV